MANIDTHDLAIGREAASQRNGNRREKKPTGVIGMCFEYFMSKGVLQWQKIKRIHIYFE